MGTELTFDKFKGASITVEEVLIFGKDNFSISPESFSNLKKQVGMYLRANSGTQESGAIFGPDCTGKVGKLPKMFRWADKK